jgi:hypothetical protein
MALATGETGTSMADSLLRSLQFVLCSGRHEHT